MKKYLSVIIAAAILVSFSACKKKVEEEVTQAPLQQGPIIDTPSAISDHGTGPKIQFDIVVPPEVESSWSGVIISIEDKIAKKTQEYTVALGDEFQIPGSNLKIKVDYFLPDFKMSGQIITSASNTPTNPAAGIIIYEDGNQVFPETGQWGWLYSEFPTIHQFQHDRYSLSLKEGKKKQ